jgi:hypothetical protein
MLRVNWQNPPISDGEIILGSLFRINGQCVQYVSVKFTNMFPVSYGSENVGPKEPMVRREI